MLRAVAVDGATRGGRRGGARLLARRVLPGGGRVRRARHGRAGRRAARPQGTDQGDSRDRHVLARPRRPSGRGQNWSARSRTVSACRCTGAPPSGPGAGEVVLAAGRGGAGRLRGAARRGAGRHPTRRARPRPALPAAGWPRSSLARTWAEPVFVAVVTGAPRPPWTRARRSPDSGAGGRVRAAAAPRRRRATQQTQSDRRWRDESGAVCPGVERGAGGPRHDRFPAARSCEPASPREGHELVAEFCDDGYSGARLDRPGLDALRDQAEAGAFEAVWCLSPDRLARAYAYQVLVLDELAQFGVRVLFSDAPALDDDPQTAAAHPGARGDRRIRTGQDRRTQPAGPAVAGPGR